MYFRTSFHCVFLLKWDSPELTENQLLSNVSCFTTDFFTPQYQSFLP